MGNRTKEEVRDPAASLKRKREREYNSLNQLIKDDRQRFAGQRGLLDAKLLDALQPQVGGNPVT